MSDAAQDALADILKRHSLALIDDRRRCEACIRDTPLEKDEIFALVQALKLGIPQLLVASNEDLNFTIGVTNPALINHAARLVNETGLKDNLARQAVEDWAHALKAARPAPVPPPPGKLNDRFADPPPRQAAEAARVATPDKPPTEDARRDDGKRAPDFDRAPPSDAVAASGNAVPLIGGLLAVQGLAFVLSQGDTHRAAALVFYAYGWACVLVGSYVFRRCRWIRPWAFALCALLLLPVFFVSLGFDESTSQAQRVVAILFSGAGVLMAVAAFVVLLRWKPDGPPTTQVSLPEEKAALCAMSASLAGLLLFCLTLDGVARAISYSYIFSEYHVVTWLLSLTNAVSLWLSWRVLTGQRPTLGRIVVPALLAASAVVDLSDLFIISDSDRLSFALLAPHLLVAIVQVVAAGLIAFGRSWLAAAPAGRGAAAHPDRLPS